MQCAALGRGPHRAVRFAHVAAVGETAAGGQSLDLDEAELSRSESVVNVSRSNGGNRLAKFVPEGIEGRVPHRGPLESGHLRWMTAGAGLLRVTHPTATDQQDYGGRHRMKMHRQQV